MAVVQSLDRTVDKEHGGSTHIGQIVQSIYAIFGANRKQIATKRFFGSSDSHRFPVEHIKSIEKYNER
jgi:hypothetical protein